MSVVNLISFSQSLFHYIFIESVFFSLCVFSFHTYERKKIVNYNLTDFFRSFCASFTAHSKIHYFNNTLLLVIHTYTVHIFVAVLYFSENQFPQVFYESLPSLKKLKKKENFFIFIMSAHLIVAKKKSCCAKQLIITHNNKSQLEQHSSKSQ
jgi:hypothetical protein